MGRQDFGIDPEMLRRVAGEVAAVHREGVELGLVIGGGNIFRGVSSAASGLVDRLSGDHMGMLATVMNALAFRGALVELGVEARVLSAFGMPEVAEPFSARVAREHLDAGRVVLLAAGTGNPFFTTDTAAALRALEIGADALLKATKVDGVYDKDPAKHDDAVFLPELTYQEVLEKRLAVMDAAAISLCRDNKLPLIVFNLLREGQILSVVRGERVGSLVKE